MRYASSRVGNRRLLKLAEFLEKLPPSKFDYAAWSDPGTRTNESCGAYGCALGWATSMPQFRRLGLHYRSGTPYIGRRGGFDAARVVFGEKATMMFYPETAEREATPKYVARKIRKFVAAGAKK